MGIGLKRKINYRKDGSRPVIWVHALSVGEVISAIPLIHSIREHIPGAIIVFSASTKTGFLIAGEKLSTEVNCIIDGPFDFLFTIKRYVSLINPSLFILVETDFWPNWLTEISARLIPSMLVNGRISEKSFLLYKKFWFFFKPIFNSFSLLSLQTRHDAEYMRKLGISANRIATLGNLKLDTSNLTRKTFSFLEKYDEHKDRPSLIWVCGSTHPGEEEIILRSFSKLVSKLTNLFLIIAPRDISRAEEIKKMAEDRNIETELRSQSITGTTPLLILDTLGELGSAYMRSNIAFVGGSLVRKGGHNPLEPAAFGVPTLFGPFMDNFSEIAREMLTRGGAITVSNEIELTDNLLHILTNSKKQTEMTMANKEMMKNNQQVTQRHLNEIDKLLSNK